MGKITRGSAIICGVPHISKVCPVSSRPKCQCCGKPLKPKTHFVRASREEAAVLEKIDGTAAREFIAWTSHELNDSEYSPVPIGAVARAELWRGEYEGVGRDEAKIPIFCSLACSSSFGIVMYKAGRRVQTHGEVLDRKYDLRA